MELQAMGMMNKQMNLPALTKIMREFERQNEKMDMTSEMMGDAIDDAFEVRPPAPPYWEAPADAFVNGGRLPMLCCLQPSHQRLQPYPSC